MSEPLVPKPFGSVEDDLTDIPFNPDHWRTDGCVYPVQEDNAGDIDGQEVVLEKTRCQWQRSVVMNAIEALKRDIERALPGVETKLRKPRKESGHWWLDATYGGHTVTVEWSPRRGFGISTDDLGDGYGEGPDEVFEDREEAVKQVVELLAKGSRSVPPHEVILRELRAALGFTQEQLADRLGVQQAAVSRLERRPDMTLSSLRRYVEALGGELEINVRTPDGKQLRLLDATQQKA
jgi:DNA-binding XRE family transcriptional regulator